MITFITCLFAGMGAGIGTGFAGLSAATVIAPMLIAFLGCPWYEAVGIGLASDVLASAFSAYIYHKNKNIDLKNGALMAASVLLMTFVGSYFSQYMPNNEMGWFTIICSAGMGLKFILNPKQPKGGTIMDKPLRTRRIMSILCGCGIGFYCGFMGVGGGLMMLFILTCILGYETKIAVGTSVFIMTFTALTGAGSHFYFGDISGYVPALLLCVMFTTLGAVIAAKFANKMTPENNNRATGIVLLSLGIFMIVKMIVA